MVRELPIPKSSPTPRIFCDVMRSPTPVKAAHTAIWFKNDLLGNYELWQGGMRTVRRLLVAVIVSTTIETMLDEHSLYSRFLGWSGPFGSSARSTSCQYPS